MSTVGIPWAPCVDLSAPPDVRVVASPLVITDMLLRVALCAIDGPATRDERAVLREVEEVVPLRRLRRLVPFAGCIDGLAPGPVAAPFLGPEPSLDEELHHAWHVAPRVLADDAGGLPGYARTIEIDRFEAEPERPTFRLLTTIAKVWEGVVRPRWPVIASAIERERARIGAAAAAVGWREALGSLHPDIRVDGARLEIAVVSGAAPCDLAGRPLLLVPVLDGSRACIAGPESVTVLVPDLVLRGPSGDALARALGPARARVLAALAVPATTRDLAHAVERSAGTVSEILGGLHEAGLVQRERRGACVWYRLSEAGEELVRALA